jgi:hypothetical protein
MFLRCADAFVFKKVRSCAGMVCFLLKKVTGIGRPCHLILKQKYYLLTMYVPPACIFCSHD